MCIFAYLRLLALLLISCLYSNSYQAQRIKTSLEGGVGHIVPNYLNRFPEISVRLDAAVHLHFIREKRWSSYYNFPLISLTARYNSTGNHTVFGNQFSLYPSITLFTKKNKPTLFTFGIGPTYFSRPFHQHDNPNNMAIGSYWNWHFNAGLGKKILHLKKGEIHAIISYFHASNGHVQIPNYGLNSVVFSMMYLPFQRILLNEQNTIHSNTRKWKVEWRNGIGVHEHAGTWEPVGTAKYAVVTSGLALHFAKNEYITFKSGLFSRYYGSYYSRTKDIKESSCIYFMAGSEILLGHVSIDIEGGLNLYKPYYRTFFDEFERGSNFDFFLKNYFNTRMGLNYYLFSPANEKTFNVKLGAHINANFGQADFSECSIGLIYIFPSKNHSLQ